MTFLDIIFNGWTGTFFLLVGTWYVGKKKVQGWALKFVGDFIWLYLGFEWKKVDLVVPSLIFICMDVYLFWKWRK